MKGEESSFREGRTNACAAQARLFPARVQYHNENRLTYSAPTLPEIVLMVRASINGSSDPWPREQLEETRVMLHARCLFWDSSDPDRNSVKIDEAVHAMCRAAVDMIDAELQHRRATGRDY